MDKPTEIPKFDLAEQILAEQRKLSSVRRRGPGGRAKAPTPAIAEPSTRPFKHSLICAEQEQIIAEIVARDIENLLKGRRDT
jgi:hypothetical protein